MPGGDLGGVALMIDSDRQEAKGCEDRDDARALNPQCAIKLASGNEFSSIGTGRFAHRLRDSFGLGAFEPRGFKLAGGPECIEGAGSHGVSSPVDFRYRGRCLYPPPASSVHPKGSVGTVIGSMFFGLGEKASQPLVPSRFPSHDRQQRRGPEESQPPSRIRPRRRPGMPAGATRGLHGAQRGARGPQSPGARRSPAWMGSSRPWIKSVPRGHCERVKLGGYKDPGGRGRRWR